MSNQTFELAKSIGDSLKARKFPFRVIYAPERTARADHSPVILFMRDTDTSETVETAHGAQTNGRKQATRRIPVKVLVYARASYEGATRDEHEELSDYVVDALIVALEDWNTSQKAGGIQYGEMAFLTLDELKSIEGNTPEGWPGTCYVMRFTIGRGVVTRDYLKQIRPTAALTGVGLEVDVRVNEADTPEVVPVGP